MLQLTAVLVPFGVPAESAVCTYGGRLPPSFSQVIVGVGLPMDVQVKETRVYWRTSRGALLGMLKYVSGATVKRQNKSQCKVF